MMLTVHLFASYADAYGRRQVDLHVPPGATVRDLVDRIRTPHGRAGAGVEREGGLPDRPLVAVNREYAEYDRVLEAGDEIALIPPVAGG